MSTALIIVDVQNDFLPGGALAVENGHKIIPVLDEVGILVDHVVFTRDHHPADHISFSDEPKFVDKSWPPHCVQGTEGAAIDSYLQRMYALSPVFSKGDNKTREDYSGFAGMHDGYDLAYYLDVYNVDEVYVGGLALDYCVRATALDSVVNGFRRTIVVSDGTLPVSWASGINAVADMASAGVEFMDLASIQEHLSPDFG